MDIKTAMAMRGYGAIPTPTATSSIKTPGTSSEFPSKIVNDSQDSQSEVTPSTSFKDVMGQVWQESLRSLSQAETQAMAGLENKADPQAVVQSITQAEMTLRTAIAVRDKVVEAYQEILRMPI